jgi:hypothetical protein
VQIVGRGLAAHAEIVRETIAADFVREQYEQAGDAQAKALVAAYLRKRKLLIRQIEGKVDPAVGGQQHAPHGAHHAHRTSKHGSDPYASPALDGDDGGAAAGDLLNDAGGLDGRSSALLASPMQSGGRGGDAASVSSESEIAAIEATIQSLEQLSGDNDVLRTKLLAIETTLHEQAITVVTEFDAAYAEIAAKRAEMLNKFFRAVEKEEIAINEDLKSLMTAEVDRYAEQISAAAAGGAVAGVVAASASMGRGGSNVHARGAGGGLKVRDEGRGGGRCAASSFTDAPHDTCTAATQKVSELFLRADIGR